MCARQREREKVQMMGGAGRGHKWQNVEKDDRVGRETLLRVPLPPLPGDSLLLLRGSARDGCTCVCLRVCVGLCARCQTDRGNEKVRQRAKKQANKQEICSNGKDPRCSRSIREDFPSSRDALLRITLLAVHAKVTIVVTV